MLEALKPLLESDLINEDTRVAIEEAWKAKLDEAREDIKVEIREEFAKRNEHDKTVMVEAIDRMLSESLSAEIKQIVEEKKAIAEDRVRARQKMSENAKRFENFLISKLGEEIRELREDRKAQQEYVGKLESFVIKALSEEIAEFATDKRDLVETKVRLVREADGKMKKLQRDFISRSTKLVSETVQDNLRSTLTELKDDIREARENNFGRKIFEAVAAEYGVSHMNESLEIKKLEKTIARKDRQLAEAVTKAEEANVLTESKQKELDRVQDRILREKKMASLLKPLNEEKAKVMRGLLENTSTKKLSEAFDKYMPAVMSGSPKKAQKARPKAGQKVLNEHKHREVTGDRKSQPKADVSEEAENIVQLRQLAGIK